MNEEVRYQLLRPGQTLERRKACPVAYIPIGTLEWHGVHNPLGADTLQAEGLAILCARKGGGVVFPPLYYGENRCEALIESNAGDRADVAKLMELPPDNFEPQNFPFSVTEQTLAYQRLLLHILAEVQSLGYELGVIVPGHYPQIDHARSAVLLHNQMRFRGTGRKHMLAWAFVDYLLVRDQYEYCGDHGALWETSHCMAICPESVDLSVLPPGNDRPVGTGGKHPRQSTAEFGRETLERAADVAVKEVQHRLANRDMYYHHGLGLQEGLWKKDAK